MQISEDRQDSPRALTPFERARLVSEALSDAARRARLSTRSRRKLSGSFHLRRGERMFRLLRIISFWLVAVLPGVIAGVYFGFMASDQYVTEFKFTVTGAEPPPIDRIMAFTGIPAARVVQDTQIVVNHLSTRAAVESIMKSVDLRAIYSRESIDWFSRFNPQKPVEKFVRYWSSMVTASISMPAGIVQIGVNAFSPEDSYRIALAALKMSEDLINELNERMVQDAISSAEREVDQAKKRLMNARIALQNTQNERGMLDVQTAGKGLIDLMTQTRSALLKLQNEYEAQLKTVRETAPQMQGLRDRIDSLQKQLIELQSKLTATASDSKDSAISSAMITFSQLTLERQIAERHYAGALASLEAARIGAERRQMYLNAFLKPSLPEEPKYPRRLLMTFLSILGGVATWGVLVAGMTLIRNHMA